MLLDGRRQAQVVSLRCVDLVVVAALCARLRPPGRQVYILPRLGVNRFLLAWDSPESFVRSPSVLQSSLLCLEGQTAPLDLVTRKLVDLSARLRSFPCLCCPAARPAPGARAPLTTPRREAEVLVTEWEQPAVCPCNRHSSHSYRLSRCGCVGFGLVYLFA